MKWWPQLCLFRVLIGATEISIPAGQNYAIADSPDVSSEVNAYRGEDSSACRKKQAL